jgi:hypothetical protein
MAEATMTASREDTDTMLQSLMLDATNEIAAGVEDVVSAFITSGGYGSLRMHMMSNERIAKAFRSAARGMAVQARAHAGGRGAAVADLVETHLFALINRTIEKRTEHIAAGKVAFQEAEILCADLRHDLKRLKDVAVRDLRNLPSDMPIGETMRWRSKWFDDHRVRQQRDIQNAVPADHINCPARRN